MPSREDIDLFFGSPYEQGSQHPDARDPRDEDELLHGLGEIDGSEEQAPCTQHGLDGCECS